MVPKKSLFFAGATLLTLGVASAQQGGSPVFRRVTKPLQTVSLDLQTGTITRGPAVQNKGVPSFTTCVSLFNNDFSGFVGVDSGQGAANGPCEWIDVSVKGLGNTGGKSGYMTGFQFAYCSAALDPGSGGPGGTTIIGFRSGYAKGTAANAGGPSGTLQGAALLTGLPANTASSSFFGGFNCFLIGVTLGTTPLCLPDGNTGWSWQFADLGTDGTLAATFPFLSCVQSCSGSGPDQTGGMTDCVDQYCPAGSILSSFSFNTAPNPGTYFTSISMQINEAAPVTSTSVLVNVNPNPSNLTNTSQGVGSGSPGFAVLGENWRVTLNCTNPPATIGKFALIRVSFVPGPTILTKWGRVVCNIQAGTGITFIIPVPASRIVNLGPLVIPKDLNLYNACYCVQGFCPRTGMPGYLSDALAEKTGSN